MKTAEQKRQNLPAGLWPGLWVVATPIGNLADLSPRAREALGAAETVLCEDTRRGAVLMASFGISPSLVRLDAHASLRDIERLVERLKGGESMALITDAGTPGISDPAAAMVRAARAAGIRVTPVPGVSAVTALLSVSGFSETAFVFGGFFPRKVSDRRAGLKTAASSASARVFVWYESPERIAETLEMVAEVSPRAEVVVGKEITKLHERFFAGTAQEVSSQVKFELSREGTRGEWCFSVLFPAREEVSVEAQDLESSDWVKALHCLIEAGISPSESARKISHHFGVSRKAVYEIALRISGKK